MQLRWVEQRAHAAGLASFVPASFLKQLFVQSEVESRNFGEVSDLDRGCTGICDSQLTSKYATIYRVVNWILKFITERGVGKIIARCWLGVSYYYCTISINSTVTHNSQFFLLWIYSVLHIVLHNEIHSAAFDVTDRHVPTHPWAALSALV
jgi:hypothetical protein